MAAKEKDKKVTLKRLSILVGGAIIIAAIVVQVILDTQYCKHTEYPSTPSVTSMITQAVRGLSEPAVIEPVSKKVYLPDVDLVLPPKPKNMSNLLYGYMTGPNNSISEVNVSLTAAVNASIAKMLSADAEGAVRHNPSYVFSKVPGTQACARGVHLDFGKSIDYGKPAFTKKLNDGRTVRIYNNETSCPYNLAPLTNYLKQVESY